MRRCIVCVGGTGQILLHYYSQLYLLGVVREPFDAVVIDSDELLPSLGLVRDYLKLLSVGQEAGRGFGTDVARVSDRKLAPQAGTASEALTGLSAENLSLSHPVRAFFSGDSLQQDLLHGLFARPALSAVISAAVVPQDAVNLVDGQTVVVVGSVIGGTGGGLLAPVLDRLEDIAARQDLKVKLRAVVIGEYFRAQAGLLAGDEGRFKSNQILVTHTIKESLDALHSYALIGGTGAPIDRDPTVEKAGLNLPWPEREGHPFWRALQALHFLLTEHTMDRNQAFENREVAPERFQSGLRIVPAKARLVAGLGVASEMVSRDVPGRLAAESVVRPIWGAGLPAVFAHFWWLAAQVGGDADGAGSFPAIVQREMEKLLEGGGDRRGLNTLFPLVEEPMRCAPGSLARIPWPDPKDAGQAHRDLVPTVEAVARRAAATLIFWALREGR